MTTITNNYNQEMNMEQELLPNTLDRILCVKVGKVIRENLYEMARKYWKVKLEKASRATHVLAVVNGIVDHAGVAECIAESKHRLHADFPLNEGYFIHLQIFDKIFSS